MTRCNPRESSTRTWTSSPWRGEQSWWRDGGWTRAHRGAPRPTSVRDERARRLALDEIWRRRRRLPRSEPRWDVSRARYASAAPRPPREGRTHGTPHSPRKSRPPRGSKYLTRLASSAKLQSRSRGSGPCFSIKTSAIHARPARCLSRPSRSSSHALPSPFLSPSFPALRVEEVIVEVDAQVGGDFPRHVVPDVASKPNAVQRVRPARPRQ